MDEKTKKWDNETEMLTETAAMIVGYNKEMARQANKCQCKKEDK